MGPKQSSPAAEGVRVRAYSSSDVTSGSGSAAVLRYYAGGLAGQIGEPVQYSSDRPGSFIQSAIIPTGGRRDVTDGERALLIGSLPAHLSPHLLGAGFHCPMCSKFVCSDEIDIHLPMCFSKPRLYYNEDVLSRDSGECSICLDEMTQGDTIARLTCLCIYHKGCIDEWFEVNRSCPEHPTD
ncbi:E3 ubiquitin-protein ligase znrf2-like [Myxocyprinus asiaticus]|uniref:E3 ubiquitin-protein ligase znrf2-like n=1 Tax=Myxocyprinus asiaticus TaxID=70543 RepID=UPI00222194E7|nr:E3 ubiquitin-protein ligase znrf2-like [Myxocyprinus asiaticus]